MVRVSRRLLLIAAVYVAAIGAAGYLGYRILQVNAAMKALPEAPLGAYKGPEKAEKVMVEILDYRCSHCRETAPIVEEFRRRHPDVKIVYRHYPVFGMPSIADAEVALAAAMQGEFEAMHDILIQRETPMSQSEIEQTAEGLGLDMEKFRRDLKGPESGSYMLQTMDIVEKLKINAVPAFFIEREYFGGTPTEAILEGMLVKAYGKDAAKVPADNDNVQ